VLFEEERFDPSHPLAIATEGVCERYLVPRDLLSAVSSLAAPPRVLAIMRQPAPPSFAEVAMPPSLGLFLAGVADPGNVGTIVRSAAALGCDWVALGSGSSDPYHPRAVRAAMGATFALPLLLGVAADDLATREGLRIVAAVPAEGRPPWQVDLAAPHVLALGSERAGLADSLRVLEAAFDVERVTIPQTDAAESLNVSAAAAALLAEAGRQRATGG
jgi:TrmH family RNA methyltransferase